MAMEPEDDFSAMQKRITNALVATTRSTTQVCAEDLAFYRSIDPAIANGLDVQHARLLALAEKLLANGAAGTAIPRPKLPDGDSLETNWRGVVDVIDRLLERTDTCLDEFKGALKKAPEQVATSTTTSAAPGHTTSSTPYQGKVPRNLNIIKPQRFFEEPPNNKETGAFKPLLTSKPHAIVPLEESLRHQSPFNIQTGTEQYEHPYKVEIEQYAYPSFVTAAAEPTPYLDYESTSATYVDTLEGLDEMLQELKQAKEIAVDLEHHDLRSYIGIVSLMQISTRNKDWIIDTLKPWRRRLECLNEVFADPNILKVFQGAYMDVIWLQRDLGLYLVGLFDTHFACRALKYPGASLQYLLKHFCNYDAQKQYQMADWRIRPIPTEMLSYARSDTHFLLYIYDNMRNELLEASSPEEDLLQDVLQRSKDCTLTRYENPIYDSERGLGANGWYRLLQRTPTMFTKEQFSVYRAVHAWRDATAREEDDSINFILNNHNVMAIAREMPLDREWMLKIIQSVSQPVKMRIDELVAVVRKAKQDAGPEMMDVMKQIESLDISGKPAPSKTHGRQAVPVPVKETAKDGQNQSAFLTPPVLKRAVERLKSSQLWGSMFPSKQSNGARPVISMPLPMPAVTAEIFEGSKTAPDSPAPQVEHAYVPAAQRAAPQTDDVFIIKGSKGHKRKLSEVQKDAAANTPPDPQLGGEEETRLSKRQQKKAERKQAKLDKKREAAGFSQQADEMQLDATSDIDDAIISDRGVPDSRAGSEDGEIEDDDDKDDEEDYEPSLTLPTAKGQLSARKQAKAAFKLAVKQAYGRVGAQLAALPPSRSEEEKMDRKLERTRLRKEAKEQTKLLFPALYPPESIDYAAQPSLIVGTEEQGGKRKKKDKGGVKKAVFDVYNRAMDAPKGLGRAQKGQGKTTTFSK
ncbi:hypothetical protein BT63DRAFT_384403 [Microthyrium microscopicum]|uniref:HRDC domain-containing protein n=1 Tax=Microthyrium microscopicum TaxID=703497 RepID=A0A6A6UJP0_9PEZI|nr:hypothetical protein BT63DRAFT_384403 [Microthyrium microscopicum]